MRLADELPGRKAPVCEVIKENVVWHQARHRHHLPAGARQQYLVQTFKVWNLVRTHGQVTHAQHKFVASAAGQELGLPLKQRFPCRMFSGGVAAPALVNRPVWARDLILFHGAEKLAKAASA